METKKSTQKAGNDSVLNQVENQTINIGADEKRVREVVSEQMSIVIDQASAVAKQVAQERTDKFMLSLIPTITQVPNYSQAMAEPSVLRQLLKSGEIASLTDREIDYKILSQLVARRIEKNGDINSTTAVSKAIEIVDQISNEGYKFLTIEFVLFNYFPVSFDFYQRLRTYSELFERLSLNADLPNQNTTEWIENLEITNSVRYSSAASYYDFWKILLNFMPAVVLAGIKKENDEYRDAIEKLSSQGMNDSFLVTNPLDTDYVIIPVLRREGIKEIKVGNDARSLFGEQVKVLEEIFDSYSNYKIPEEFIKYEIQNYEGLKDISEWWDTFKNRIGQSVYSLTSVGKVLGYMNARQLDQSLPEIDL
ncbi:MAG: hypothetical protein LBM27_02185 [Lactobacillaceae bacterium]|nr:hypothetical protein [Lactobacillaceae bacterium]